jgi:hypothetical protein
MSRSTADLTVGYTMQSDFWFRVDGDGNVNGEAYAVYQPTFDPAGLNGKVNMAKGIVDGALDLLPGGEIAVVGRGMKLAGAAGKAGIHAGKALGTGGVAGLVGVALKSNDPSPIRKGGITGALRRGMLTLQWAGKQPTEIPVTVSLQYINVAEPISQEKLPTRVPWHSPATVDPDSGGRFAIAQEQQSPDKPSKDGVTESLFSYWTATRVE